MKNTLLSALSVSTVLASPVLAEVQKEIKGDFERCAIEALGQISDYEVGQHPNSPTVYAYP